VVPADGGDTKDAALPKAQMRGSAAIAARLRRAITEGVYRYGERLPAEREMARSFGASRMTVRSALDLLEERNFIERKVGSGTFVVHERGVGEREIADITSPLELMDMRQAVEPHMVRLAVLHGTVRDLEALAQKLRRLEQTQADRDQFTRCDQDFHMAVANATHNPLAIWIYRQINEVRQHTQWSRVKDKVLTPARIAAYNRQHRALFESIAGRHAESAIELINRHLAEAKSDLIGVQSK
jgi:GntR family uxuAB operon transcriptional repressor